MIRAHLLPVGLLALILSLPVAVGAELVSHNDPFYNIAKEAQRAPEPPVCCLKPLEPLDPPSAPADEILSFEEWKAKQELMHNGQQRHGDGQTSRSPYDGSHAVQQEPQAAMDDPLSADVLAPQQQQPASQVPPPRPRVPLTDRFNYASLDCSARVHAAHRSSKSPASLLSSKKDRYMLSPCTTPGEDKFVVVELCEDIRIDTVQLANFEFFSGVFRDFSVSVAKTHTTDPEGWTPAGTYRAKNIRGVQSFHTPATLRDFYRFIRIDFHSHYGNEFYCPVSLLRVYGLTHLEQYKWEEWEAESHLKRGEADLVVAQAPLAAELPIVQDAAELVKEFSASTAAKVNENSEHDAKPSEAPRETADMSASSTTLAPVVFSELPLTESTPSSDSVIVDSNSPETLWSEQTGTAIVSDSVPSEKILPAAQTTTFETSVPTSPDVHGTSSDSSDTVLSESQTTSLESVRASQISSRQSSPSTIPTIVPHEARNVPALASSGESIFRTIMTRLTALETNSTLILRYVEEQTRSLRDTLRRLEEDVGRLEGLGRLQAQTLQKTVNEWDRQKRRLEREHFELLARVDNLTDEVILEKRLGIAQLCLLLIVLVFMALTRGSRVETLVPAKVAARHDSLKEWGRRHLSNFSSGDWATKLRNRSLTPTPISMERKERRIPDFEVSETNLPASGSLSASRLRAPAAIHAPSPRHFVSRRPITPTSSAFGHSSSYRSSLNTLVHSPGGASPGRPRLRRMSSHNSPVAITHTLSTGAAQPLSVKKFAKTAHLHEIRRVKSKTLASMKKGTQTPESSKYDRKNSSASENATIEIHETYSDAVYRNKASALTDEDESEQHHAGARKPLSVLPLQNRARSPQHLLRVLDSPWQGSGTKVIDLDAESENGWVDTDIEGSEVGERKS